MQVVELQLYRVRVFIDNLFKDSTSSVYQQFINHYIYIYILYIYIYIYIYICIYAIMKTMCPRLPQWLCSESYDWAHDKRLQHCSSCAQVHELPESHGGDNWEGMITPVLLLRDLSTVCRGSLMTTYVIYTYIDRRKLIQVWNMPRNFSLSCFRHVVNSVVDRTETYIWIWPILIIFVKLHSNCLRRSMILY